MIPDKTENYAREKKKKESSEMYINDATELKFVLQQREVELTFLKSTRTCIGLFTLGM